MLAELTPYENIVSLINESGVQFLDFGLSLNLKKEAAGNFCRVSEKRVARLLTDKNSDYFHLAVAENKESSQVAGRAGNSLQRIPVEDPHFTVAMESSLKLLNNCWLPAPVLRFRQPSQFDVGPINWARFRVTALETPDVDGNNYRVVIAFDTRAMAAVAGLQYLAPSIEDIKTGAVFKMACHDHHMNWFVEQDWVLQWLEEIFVEANKQLDDETLAEYLQERRHLAHYLNVLSLFARTVPEQGFEENAKVLVPEIKMVANEDGDQVEKISVDLILDVGNSRTCGILIEDHGQAGDGMKCNYQLKLRDLTNPEVQYQHAFESRVEFSQAQFGKDNFSVKSGRHDAFLWPTIARVGSEAAKLAGQRRGTEGSTGISSPKRYLWDQKEYAHGWRFNNAYIGGESEPKATAAPFSNRISSSGEAFFNLPEDDRIPVFFPKYSRSSLMTFMLAEVIAQALIQINSPSQRTLQGHTHVPRRMQSITLTVPPGMPQAERSLLYSRLQQAVVLVWQCMGWYEGENNPYKKPSILMPQENFTPKLPLPKIRADWDEASCGQLVYLYNEIRENFAGHPEEFFNTVIRPDKKDKTCLTMASIDIGGGTTDVVVTDYSIEQSDELQAGANVSIKPKQRFRDGFKVAGDDILLDVIRGLVLPSFKEALIESGVQDADSLMSKLCGSDNLSAQDSVLRQQLNLQVFTPIGLAMLKEYEHYNIEHEVQPQNFSYQELLGENGITFDVKEFVAGYVRRAGGKEIELAAVTANFDMVVLHRMFVNGASNIARALDSICEVISQYPCDVLLITGRPSCLPGVQSYIRMRLPLPPGRIVFMKGYRTGGWYPFHANGRIEDPKSTAAVGAMLCMLSEKRNITNFYFRANLLKPYSTIKHIGVLDENGILSNNNVLYGNIKAIDGCLQLHAENEEPKALAVKGSVVLGYRQLAAERWAAAPLYRIELKPKAVERLRGKYGPNGENPCVLIAFDVSESKREVQDEVLSDRLKITDVKTNVEAVSLSERDVDFHLYTLNSTQSSASDYWMDSGNVNLK